MKTAQEISDIYSNSTGTENWYQHWTKRGTYTDGVKGVADKAGAYWLIDAIFSYARKEPFQLWELAVSDSKALLTMREDSGLETLVRQRIEYTDFPEGKWKFYFTDGVLLLPGEY